MTKTSERQIVMLTHSEAAGRHRLDVLAHAGAITGKQRRHAIVVTGDKDAPKLRGLLGSQVLILRHGDYLPSSDAIHFELGMFEEEGVQYGLAR